MKTVPLRTFKDGQYTTRDQLLHVLKTVPTQGILLGQMRARLALLDKFEGATEQVLLEDSEHQELVAILNGTSWAVVDKDVLAVCDDVLKAI